MLHIHANNPREHFEIEHASGPIEFGRGSGSSLARRAIVQDPYVSRSHIRLEEAAGRLIVTNISQKSPVLVERSEPIEAGKDRVLPLPARLIIGQTVLQVSQPATSVPPDTDAEQDDDQTVATSDASFQRDSDEDPLLTGKLETIHRPRRSPREGRAQTLIEERDRLTPTRVLRWVETLISIQRAAAGSPEFYHQTARALVEVIGLDTAMVLMSAPAAEAPSTGSDDWRVVAHFDKAGRGRPTFSRRVVDAIVREKRTFYQIFEERPDASLVDIEAVVASPILGGNEAVIGILYGSRSHAPSESGRAIGPLEAQIVQLLATAMESSLARAWQEAELARVRHNFEHFFSPELAAEIERNPRLLEGQQRDVTVLFLDIRGFTSLAERLPPRDVYRLAEDFMDRITAQIEKHRGVVVDYAGDGVLAMWNAPAEQREHAALACAAALDIWAEVPVMDEAWHRAAGTRLRIGIGLSTGPAQVGNAGSRNRVKYGPRGHTVNVGHRIESATKHLGVPILLSGATRAAIGAALPVRRLCRARAPGLVEAVDLFELPARDAGPAWQQLRATYEEALALYEAGRWDEALVRLQPLLATPAGKEDAPTLLLLGRTVDALRNPPSPFCPVIELTEK